MSRPSNVGPLRVFPILLFAIAIPLLLGGAQLLLLGGSFYYLLAGALLLFSALRLWQGNPQGLTIYGVLMAVTVVWSLFEAGNDLWALAPRILPFAALGLWSLTPWVRGRLCTERPPGTGPGMGHPLLSGMGHPLESDSGHGMGHPLESDSARHGTPTQARHGISDMGMSDMGHPLRDSVSDMGHPLRDSARDTHSELARPGPRFCTGRPLPLWRSRQVQLITFVSVLLAAGVIISGMGYDVQPMGPRKALGIANSRTDWPSYGNTLEGTRYSPLRQINSSNAGELELAWSYRTGQGGAFKATPIQVGELLYVCTGGNVIIALDAETGQLRWQFDPQLDPEHLESVRYFSTGCRGVSYYKAPPDYPGECAERILTATADARMIAVDALTGQRCTQFGNIGEVDLSENMGNDPRIFYFVTSPPGIVRGNAVVGGWVLDNNSVGEPSGVVRAFNAISGEFAWAWDMGRPGLSTQPLQGEVYTRGTPNVWSLFSVDEDLGLIYAPTGNETPDYFGGHRQAVSEQFASSVVAIDGATGAVRWSFQTVHHDIWDYDVPSQPVLTDIPGDNGTMIPVVLVPTKRAEVFVLNRVTGEPVFDIQELPVPQSGGVPEDHVAPTQPFAMDLPHFRPDLSEAKMWGITPLDQLWCRIEYNKMRYDGHFTVPGADTILQFPGNAGGHNWGSVSVDEVNHLMIVNPLLMANQLSLIPRDQIPGGGGNQRGTPYASNTVRFISPLGVPCTQPPYGVLAAIDLETRELLWERPIGTAKASGPLGIATRLPITIGTPQGGGTVTTAGGLIFLAGTFDNTIRAMDIATGRELWQSPLPFTAQATPMTYMSPGGRQTVVVTIPVYNSTEASGARVLPAAEEDPLGGYIHAYRLPD